MTTHITDVTFEQEVLKSEVPVLVDFYADWCGPCKAAAPSIETLSTEYEGKAKVCKLDVDTGSKFLVENGLKGIPAFLLFKGGVKIGEFVGWHPTVEQQLREAIDAALAS